MATARKIIWTVIALVLGALALLTVRPELFGPIADMVLKTPGSQVIALRGWLVIVFGVAGLFMLIVAIIRRVSIHRGGIAFLIAAVFFLTAGLHGATMYSRGLENPGGLSPDRGITAASPGDGSITVLQYNTLGGKTTAINIIEVIEANGVDVVTLPETSSEMGAEIVAELAARGQNFQQFDTGTSGYEADYDSTVLLISSALGSYTAADAFPNGGPSSVRAVSSAGTFPDFVAVHPIAPVSNRSEEWREQIDAVYGLCEALPRAVISGDFNSTADHQAALGYRDTCTDAVAQGGSGAVGTWSTSVPSFFGSPIDRVLAPSGYEGTEAAVVQVGESDHRGVLVRLTPVG